MMQYFLPMMREFRSIFSAAVSSAQWFHFLHLFICWCCFVVVVIVTVVDALFGVCAVYTYCIHIILLSSVNFLAMLWSRHSVHFVMVSYRRIYAVQTPRQKSIWIIEKAFWSQYLWTSISYVWNRIFDGITFRNMHSLTSMRQKFI